MAIWRIYFSSNGEELEQAKKDTLELLKIIEEHRAGETKFFIGDEFGIVDIAFGAIGYWLEVVEDVVGVKLYDARKFPKLTALINNFKEEPVIKENLPDKNDLLTYFRGSREKRLASAS
ncbi:glutathione S-transferase-like [Tripterygium wilfordii]|uniref:Glutathione S-transferase-like n=2 Tax=Tripterygium wilfordii TaxID=458696 RepID=A0A7J7DXA7_TRIWF|nr:glutathione S-transferase-like [Tripterygium wilfordii]